MFQGEPERPHRPDRANRKGRGDCGERGVSAKSRIHDEGYPGPDVQALEGMPGSAHVCDRRRRSSVFGIPGVSLRPRHLSAVGLGETAQADSERTTTCRCSVESRNAGWSHVSTTRRVTTSYAFGSSAAIFSTSSSIPAAKPSTPA